MRQRMWRSILALSIGAVISATAAAQTPPPAVQAPAPTPVVVVSTSGCGGCEKPASSCNSCDKGKASKHHGGGLFRIGEGCASTAGCSSCKQERTFLFGSCHQFFNAGNDCGRGNGHGPCGPVSPCTYFSYQNR